MSSPRPILTLAERAPVKSVPTHAYLVGGGIASLAAAAFLIRDGGMKGSDITIFEELGRLGGSLDGAGNPKDGYVLRGGRMFESKYLCTFELFASIPKLDGSGSVTDEIMSWNQTLKTSSHARLVRRGAKEMAPPFGLSEAHILTIERLAIEPERLLGRSTIADEFDAAFFKTNFWYMWCTTFAFQPWHSAVEFKRYLMRFVHMVEGFNQLHGIMRTLFNQYDSMLLPLQKWLEGHGVNFELHTRVTDLALESTDGQESVRRIAWRRNDQAGETLVGENDKVLVTLGSMTEASSLGTNDRAATLLGKRDGGSWTLWETIARNHPSFGRPANFFNHVAQSKWLSFTATLHDPSFLRMLQAFTGNVPGEGGLVTFPDSPWLMSIVVPFQPHFIGQPADVNVFWGYGLAVDTPGEYVRKPMSECSGREIMEELMFHLDIGVDRQNILATSTCIPCMMPFITSQFLPRERGDRPDVIPANTRNLAFIGQFCEMPDDVVFTVEYSVRSAQTAVYALLDLKRSPPPVYKGIFNPRVAFRAFMALHDRPLGKPRARNLAIEALFRRS